MEFNDMTLFENIIIFADPERASLSVLSDSSQTLRAIAKCFGINNLSGIYYFRLTLFKSLHILSKNAVYGGNFFWGVGGGVRKTIPHDRSALCRLP